MPMPYYVSPEQMMQDKAEYAKKGIAKGRSIIAMEYVNGILLAAENPSASLHKISEIYDNIAFAGAGKYSKSEAVQTALKEKVPANPPDLKNALNLCIVALEQTGNQKLSLESLEVAVLDRTRDSRKFRRYTAAETKQFLA